MLDLALSLFKKKLFTNLQIYRTSCLNPQSPIINPQPGTDFWLWEMLTIRIGRVATKLAGHGEEINNMLAFYDVMKPIWCEKMA